MNSENKVLEFFGWIHIALAGAYIGLALSTQFAPNPLWISLLVVVLAVLGLSSIVFVLQVLRYET